VALGTGQLSLNDIKSHFSLSSAAMSGMTSTNTDRFIGSIPSQIGPSYSDVSISDFHGASNRTAQITVGKSTASYAPDRYGWGLANYTGFYHAENGYNSAAFGSIQRYQGLIGNNLVGIVTHDVSQLGTTDNQDDVHLEIFTTSSSNSGWTYMDVKFAGDFQYQAAGYIAYTFTRTAASHFTRVGGVGNSYQPSNTVYAWTFTGKDSTSWYYHTAQAGGHPTDNDNVRSLHTAFKSAYGGNYLSTPYIRFR